jgi:excisionase family DNA binding protein
MLLTTPPTPTRQPSSADHNPTNNSVPPIDQNASPVLVACFVLPSEQAEALITMLQRIAANSPTPSPANAQPANAIPEFKSQWLTHSEAARYLGVAVSTLYHYAEQERVECRKIGNRLEYRRSSLDRFKESLIRPVRRSRNRGTIAPMLLGSGN